MTLRQGSTPVSDVWHTVPSALAGSIPEHSASGSVSEPSTSSTCASKSETAFPTTHSSMGNQTDGGTIDKQASPSQTMARVVAHKAGSMERRVQVRAEITSSEQVYVNNLGERHNLCLPCQRQCDAFRRPGESIFAAAEGQTRVLRARLEASACSRMCHLLSRLAHGRCTPFSPMSNSCWLFTRCFSLMCKYACVSARLPDVAFDSGRPPFQLSWSSTPISSRCTHG